MVDAIPTGPAVDDAIIEAWRPQISTMRPNGREAVTLLVRATVKACNGCRRYRLIDYAHDCGLPENTLASRFFRAGAVGPSQIIRAVRALVALHIAADLRARGVPVRVARVWPEMGLSSPQAFSRFVTLARPPGYHMGPPTKWLRLAPFNDCAIEYGRRLFGNVAIWGTFEPLTTTDTVTRPVRICAECSRPYYGVAVAC